MLERFRQFWTNVWAPLGDLLLRMGVSPNAVTLVGTLGVCAGALVCFPQGWLLAGVLVITAFVFSDMIDGYMARTSGQLSPFGAFLDSTTDRVSEAFMLGAIGLVFMRHGHEWALALCFAAVTGSFLVSYTRARAEALGLRGDVGVGSRAERVVVITGGLVLAPWGVLPWAIALLTATAWITVLQRILHVRRQLLDRPPPS